MAYIPNILQSSYTPINVDSNLSSNGSYLVDGSSNSVTLTLPVSANDGDLIFIFCEDSTNVVSVTGSIYESSGTETLTIGESLQLKFDNTLNWMII